jgi:hypothetical protein
VRSNKHTPNLDDGFLEPQMVSLFDQFTFRLNGIAGAAGHPPLLGSVFYYQELIHTLDLMEEGYSLYKITTILEYSQLRGLLSDLAGHMKGNYRLTIPLTLLHTLQQKYQALCLLVTPAPYADLLYDYAPFRTQGNDAYTTVPLLMRYIDRALVLKLLKIRRYQVHAGFTFEKRVLATLKSEGFVSKKITRLKRAEFDVVTEKDGKIYNFQCKNNYIDTFRINQDWEAIGKKNKYYVNRYKAAIAKELKREHLLQERFPGQAISHYVVSRFPVIHEMPELINLNMLQDWAERQRLGGYSMDEAVQHVLKSIYSYLDEEEDDSWDEETENPEA